MSGVDVGRFFQRLKQLLAIESWELLHDGGPEGLLEYAPQKNMSVVRIQRVEPVTLEQRLAMARPEFHSSPEFQKHAPVEKQIREHVAPSDAVMAWVGKASSIRGALPGLPDPEMSALRTVGMIAGNMDLSKGAVLRVTCWRDFPEAGQFTSLFVPVSGEDSRGSLAYWICGTAIGDTSVLTQHFMEVPWPTFPDPMQAGLRNFFRLMAMQWERLSKPEIVSQAETIYVVASLRSCARGPPLVPFRKGELDDDRALEMGGYTWAPARHEGFNLPAYLQHLMRTAGVTTTRCFDSLDGRKLVPYQAAVLRGSDWEKVQAEFVPLFRMQQAAYRRLRGGRAAPKLYFGHRPSFLNLRNEAPPPPQPAMRFTQRNTFVEWAEVGPVGQQSRPAEYP